MVFKNLLEGYRLNTTSFPSLLKDIIKSCFAEPHERITMDGVLQIAAQQQEPFDAEVVEFLDNTDPASMDFTFMDDGNGNRASDPRMTPEAAVRQRSLSNMEEEPTSTLTAMQDIVSISAGSSIMGKSDKALQFAHKKMVRQRGKENTVPLSLVLIGYTSSHDLPSLLRTVDELYPDAYVAGSSSNSGVAVNGHWESSRNKGLGTWCLTDRNAVVEVVHIKQRCELLQDVIQQQLLLKRCGSPFFSPEGDSLPPNFVLMFGSPGREEDTLAAIDAELGNVPVFGGSSADADFNGGWSQFSKVPGMPASASSDGVILVLVWCSCEVFTSMRHGYELTNARGLQGVVTKVDSTNRNIIEIDNKPAADVFIEWSLATGVDTGIEMDWETNDGDLLICAYACICIHLHTHTPFTCMHSYLVSFFVHTQMHVITLFTTTRVTPFSGGGKWHDSACAHITQRRW
jgi:hypothetical protein